MYKITRISIKLPEGDVLNRKVDIIATDKQDIERIREETRAAYKAQRINMTYSEITEDGSCTE